MIQSAINDTSAFAVLVSTHAFQSKWVGKELRIALDVQRQRGRDKFPVFALLMNGEKLGVFENFFDEEPIFISVSSAAGGAEAAVDPILVAMGKRKAHDPVATPQPNEELLEELVLELSDFRIHEQDGVRRPSAHARLTYEPATPGLSHIRSTQSRRFIAPIGPIEAEELRWYLGKFAIWPSDYFRDRARKVEDDLKKWGALLHAAAMPDEPTANVMTAWKRIDGQVQRRFSVHIDAAPEAGTNGVDLRRAGDVNPLICFR